MAIIYGRPDSEVELLNRSPDSVKNVEDVEIVHKKLQEELADDKKDFLKKVPGIITNEEQKLEKIKYEEKRTEQKFDEKLKQLDEEKTKGGFSALSAPLQSFFVKNYSKRKEINKIRDMQEKQLSYIKEWKERPDHIFKTTRKEKISEINELEEVKDDPFHAGAKGEVLALKKLSELSNDYHIFCGVRAELPNYVRYNGKRNLRTAQLDFTIVSKRGIILVEVKNWSNKFYRENDQISPHEQVDRASRVLWIAIKSRWGWWKRQNPSVTSVLLSIQDNMRYNPRFKFVNVCNLNRINYFIENRREQLSDGDVNKLIKMLKNHVSG